MNERMTPAAKVHGIADAMIDSKPTTLADMSPEERWACQWMQADMKTRGRASIVIPDLGDGRAILLDKWGNMIYQYYEQVTPLPDLPRMEGPSVQ